MVPKSVNQLTLIQYARFVECELSELSDEDKPVKLLSIVTGLKQSEILEMPMGKANKLLIQLARLRSSEPTKKIKRVIWIKGRRYRMCKDETELNTNQYTALKEYQKNPIRNYHNIASLFYINAPLFREAKFDAKNHPVIAREFLKRKVGEVFGALFFYETRSQMLNLISQVYLQLAEMTIQRRMIEVRQELQRSGVNTDGSIQSMRSQLEIMLSEQSS